MFFLAHPKDSNFELKSPTNMTLLVRLLMVWKSERLLEITSSIAKASFSVMIMKSSFLYSLFTARPFFTRKATLPPWPVERSFLVVS